MSKAIIRKALLTVVAAAAPFVMSSPAHAVSNCVTRSVNSTYTGATWLSKTVCNAGEIAISAGGFCSGAGDMRGVSTTSGTVDRLVWLWCNSTGQAYWYAVCCTP